MFSVFVFTCHPDALELLFAFVIRTLRLFLPCLALTLHQIPLSPAPSRAAAAKADICSACIFLIRAANSTYTLIPLHVPRS